MTENDMVKISTSILPPVDVKELLDESRKLAQSGRSSDALNLLDKAESQVLENEIISPLNRDLQLSKININRGIMYKNMRALEQSARCYEKAMQLLKEHEKEAPRELFSVELNLAVLRIRLRDRKNALSGFSKAEKIAQGFEEPERKELIRKVLTNKAQLHLEFREIDKAREILGSIISEHDGHDKITNQERNARVSSQLGLMIAQIADSEEDQNLAAEHYKQSENFFDEAIRIYIKLGFVRDALSQTINKAEVLISSKRLKEASAELEKVYSDAVNLSDNALAASSSAKLLIIAIESANKDAQDRWLNAALYTAQSLAIDARRDFLEKLESQLRWIGGEKLIAHVQKLREQIAVN
jgi:tetratricopeptide (TPR) repeat protein